MKKDDSDENCHEGHRERRRISIAQGGIAHMPEHEVLETLLFYVIPTGDVNPLAHRLIDKFGSVLGTLDAEYKELLSVKGVGPRTAEMIKFVKFMSCEFMASYYSEAYDLFNPDDEDDDEDEYEDE